MKASFRLLIIFCSILGLIMFSCEVEDDEIDIDPVEKFIGKWKCEEDSEVYGSGYNYDVIIERNPHHSTEVIITNFYMQGFEETAIALVVGSSLYIEEQGICDDTIFIEGSGSYNKEKQEIKLTYTANDGADIDNVSARYYNREDL